MCNRKQIGNEYYIMGHLISSNKKKIKLLLIMIEVLCIMEYIYIRLFVSSNFYKYTKVLISVGTEIERLA